MSENRHIADSENLRMSRDRQVFVDVDPTTFNLDPSKIEAAITERTRAIVPTHLYGQPCEMTEVMRVAERHNLVVVEDCAQAAGARYRGRLVGTFGAASFFSFQLLKGLNTYGGGMALTDDTALAARVREQSAAEPLQSTKELAQRFLTGWGARTVISPKGFTFWGYPLQAFASLFGHYDLSKHIWEKIRPLDPFPRAYRRRYSNVQAIVGLRALDKLSDFNERTRAHAALLNRGLSDCRAVQTPRTTPDAEHVYYQYCIYTSDPQRASRRAIRRGVDFETTHVDVCTTLEIFKEFASYCPGAVATERALQLPVYSRLRDSDVERVLAVVRRVTEDFSPLGEQNPSASAVAGRALTVGGDRA